VSSESAYSVLITIGRGLEKALGRLLIAIANYIEAKRQGLPGEGLMPRWAMQAALKDLLTILEAIPKRVTATAQARDFTAVSLLIEAYQLKKNLRPLLDELNTLSPEAAEDWARQLSAFRERLSLFLAEYAPLPEPGGTPEVPATPEAVTRADTWTRVIQFFSGLAAERIRRIVEAIEGAPSAEACLERLEELGIDLRGYKSRQLADLLGVDESTIRKTSWWKESARDGRENSRENGVNSRK
jgi:DNA-directed RNA polymerase specialized sigma24 family protein